MKLLIQYYTVYDYTKRSRGDPRLTALWRIYLFMVVQYEEKKYSLVKKLKSEPRCLLMENGE